jgi:thiol:disulfide interchange protein
MNKRLFLILITVFILSCSTLAPKADTDPGTTTTANNALVGFKEVRLHPKDGKLDQMLAAEAAKAVTAGLLPVVEFDADWCPPCQAIKKHLDSRNELMLKAYDGTYIIKLDVDEWGWDGNGIENFSFHAIPIYFKLDGQGKQTGESIDGGAWNEDVPVNIAPVMDKFFHSG